MKSTYFTVFLLVASFTKSVYSSLVNDSKNLTLSHTYASPQLYVFGGVGANNEVLQTASHFNSSTAEWEATTDMALEKQDSCGVAVGTKIYLFGGFNGVRTVMKTAEVYDCETGTYSQFRSMPTPRYECGAGALGDFIYVAGANSGPEMSSVIRYNIHTTRRENVSPMHTARNCLQLVGLNGRLYAIGGNTKAVEAYNPVTDRWTSMASTKNVHTCFGAAVHEGKIYVHSQNGFEVYSPETDEWEGLTPLNGNRGKTLVSMNGKLWALGGGARGTKSVHTYNIVTRNWSEQTEMDAARLYHTAFVVNH